MKVDGVEVKDLTLDQMRELIGEYIQRGRDAGSLWDLMAVVRGPDYPSERPDQSAQDHAIAYKGRRDRKRETGEVLRANVFCGKVGGGARYRTDINYVTLPPANERDHYDRHVERAAGILGLKVKVKEAPKNGVRIEIKPYSAWLKVPEEDFEQLLKLFKGPYPMNYLINGTNYSCQGRWSENPHYRVLPAIRKLKMDGSNYVPCKLTEDQQKRLEEHVKQYCIH